MNWRWKHIIICAVVGIVLGIIEISIGGTGLSSGLLIVLFPLGANLLYWGFRKTRVILGLAKNTAKSAASYNVDMARDPGGRTTVTVTKGSPLYWIVFYVFAIVVAGFVGYYAFPNAIYRAVKNVD